MAYQAFVRYENGDTEMSTPFGQAYRAWNFLLRTRSAHEFDVDDRTRTYFVLENRSLRRGRVGAGSLVGEPVPHHGVVVYEVRWVGPTEDELANGEVMYL